MTQADLVASQSALLASIAASADAAREMIAANNLPGATAVLEQIAANARDVATALSLPNRQGADLPTDPDAVAQGLSPRVLQAADRMMQFFAYEHLPPKLAEVSRPFCDLAARICDTLPGNPERTVALRKLLEAKDCAVRAALYQPGYEAPQ